MRLVAGIHPVADAFGLSADNGQWRAELVGQVGHEGAAAPTDLIRVGSDVELDVARMEARFGGRRADLTKSEFQIVALMARQPGRVFTRAQLLDAVRGVAFESYERAIDAHIKNIRRKLEQDPRAPRVIQTVFGVGYRVAEPSG